MSLVISLTTGEIIVSAKVTKIEHTPDVGAFVYSDVKAIPLVS